MTELASPAEKTRAFDISVNVALRLAIVAGLLVWCIRIFEPFLMPVVWGMIIAVAIFPMFGKLTRLTGGRRGLTAFLFTLLAIALIIIPAWQVTDSVVRSTIELDRRIDEGTLTVPAPQESVRDWPVIGGQVYGAWDAAHTNLSTARERYAPQLEAARGWALGTARGLAGGLLHTIIALIIAGFMLTFAESGVKGARSVAGRLGGPMAEGLVGTTGATIRSVAQGVLGVALVQALAAGLGMFIAGVPGWGIWTVLVLVLAVVQLPPLVVLGPVLVWYFTLADSTVAAVIFAVWALIVSISDTFLKPLFLGRGVDIPMPVILIGAIGGVIVHGIIGLFVGAVVLAIGYELFKVWMAEHEGSESAATS
jgi:predicted PurR-regulated permease PerM